MKRLLIILIFGVPITLHAQDRIIKIGVQSGFYKATDYKNIKSGHNISFEVSYFLTKRLFISTHANYGTNRYYEDQISNRPDGSVYGDGTNSDLSNIHVGLMFGYNLTFTEWFNVSGLIGVSSYTETLRYPYQYDEYTLGMAQSSFTDLAFPLRLEIGFKPLKKIEIGLIGGIYIEPDYPIVGLYFGPSISIIM